MPWDSAMRYVSASSRLSGFPSARWCGLLGIQSCPPDQALVPPTVSAFSKRPTRAPPSWAAIADVSPAAPVPSTTTSNSCIGCTPGGQERACTAGDPASPATIARFKCEMARLVFNATAAGAERSGGGTGRIYSYYEPAPARKPVQTALDRVGGGHRKGDVDRSDPAQLLRLPVRR